MRTIRSSSIEVPGIHIREPWSKLIFTGQKTVETRSYPIPKKHLGKYLAVIETRKNSSGPAKIIGLIKFESCHQYKTAKEWKADANRHLVPVDHPDFRFVTGLDKWGWTVAQAIKLKSQVAPPKKRGIVFATACSIPTIVLPKDFVDSQIR